MAINSDQLYEDLMRLCSTDDTFYYKDVRFHSIDYRIFNYRLCSYASFQSRVAALNCRGTMFNIANPKKIELVSLPPEKFFNYREGFGRQKFHERGQFGDKMEKLDGTLISTYLHKISANSNELRLKSKQSLSSKQVLEATQLLQGELKSEMEKLVRLNYTINIEYTSPTNHIFVSYTKADLSVLSIRSHADGQTLFGTQLKAFLIENNFSNLLNHLVPFEKISSDVTHKKLLEDIFQEPYGEGYVVQIIQPDQSSYLVKIKTLKYLRIHRDGQEANTTRSLFEAIITENSDDLRDLFRDDPDTLKRIDDMELQIRPKYNHMIALAESFYRENKHLSKTKFIQSINSNENAKFYLPLLINLYDGHENDYKKFAMKHWKDLFGFLSD